MRSAIDAGECMEALDDIRTGILRLKWHVAAWRFQTALRRYALALKAGFDPEQPRDELGRWVETGRSEEEDGAGDATDISSAERSGGLLRAARAAWKLIEAFRSGNGFEDMFGYSSNRTVAVTTVDGETIFGSSGRSPTFTDADGRDSERMRAALVQKYPDLMNTQNLGQFPNDALYHAEANILMRAAKRFGGSLAGKELEVYVDRPLCRSCEKVLPLLSKELGSPTVKIFDGTNRVLILRNGSWTR